MGFFNKLFGRKAEQQEAKVEFIIQNRTILAPISG